MLSVLGTFKSQIGGRISYIQGESSFLPPPNFLMCPNAEKNWPPSEKTYAQHLSLPNNWEWQVLDLVISEGGQFRTLFFSWILAHSGCGKKDELPCMYLDKCGLDPDVRYWLGTEANGIHKCTWTTVSVRRSTLVRTTCGLSASAAIIPSTGTCRADITGLYLIIELCTLLRFTTENPNLLQSFSNCDCRVVREGITRVMVPASYKECTGWLF